MERMEGYYWVQMVHMNIWAIALMRRNNGAEFWFMPGLAAPLDPGQFRYISDLPISHPDQMSGEVRIWTPDAV